MSERYFAERHRGDRHWAGHLPFDSSMSCSILDIGHVGAIEPIVITESVTPVAAGAARARVVHAAAAAPQVDVYVTEPTALLAQSVSLGRLAFGEISGQASVRVATTASPDR